MSPERTQAYRRVIQTLEDLGPSRLFMDEQDRIRYSADTLIFSADLVEDAAAREAMDDIRRLGQELVECGRWEDVTVARLVDDVSQCGPQQMAELSAA
jgi:hypothetical protein